MKKNVFAFALLLLPILHAVAQKDSSTQVLRHGAHRTGKRNDAAMQEWRNYGLGQFIHWGVYALYGGQYNGTDFNFDGAFIRGFVPNAVYDQAYKTFNPKDFNADAWALMAKKMGASLMYLTTKHHDGFCLWPSKYTDYTIANTPYKKDIVKQLVDAYNKQGIDVHLYYSILDWHHPDNRIELNTAEDSAANERFKVYIKNQLTELVQNYPTVKGLWFDGTWDDFWKKSGAFSDSLEQYLKSLNPGLIIGSRFRADEYGSRHIDSDGRLMGDFYQAWERKMPKDYADTRSYDWEFITTIGENGWGYQKKPIGHLKTAAELIELMVKAASLDGNTMINFGPMPNGTFRPYEVAKADSIGQWMHKNSVVIYNSDYAAGWAKQDWGYFTRSNKTGKIYMTVFSVPVSGSLKVTVPKGMIIKSARLYAGGQFLRIEKLDGLDYYVHLPDKNFREAFVIELETEKAELKNKDQKALT